MIQKAIDSTLKSKKFSSQSTLHAFKKYICINKECKEHPTFFALLTKEERKTALNEWESDTSDILWALYSVSKKLRQFFFHTPSLTCLNKDTSVLLKVKILEQVHKLSIKTIVLTFKEYNVYVQNLFNKVIKSYKKKNTHYTLLYT